MFWPRQWPHAHSMVKNISGGVTPQALNWIWDNGIPLHPKALQPLPLFCKFGHVNCFRHLLTYSLFT